MDNSNRNAKSLFPPRWTQHLLMTQRLRETTMMTLQQQKDKQHPQSTSTCRGQFKLKAKLSRSSCDITIQIGA